MLDKFSKISVTAIVVITLLLTLVLWERCRSDEAVPPIDPSEALPGGEGTVSIRPFASFMLPAANLVQEKRPDFHAGKALARQPWIKAPTVTRSRDGLGPVYNARTCLSCHVNGGRGVLPADSKTPLFAAFVRLSVPGKDKIQGVIPEPVYGDQLQAQSVSLSHQLRHSVTQKDPDKDPEAPPEARAYIDWQTKAFQYPDGQTRQLRYPKIRIERLGYGELDPQTMMSLRAAPAIHGMGLLELIPQADIDRLADPDDSDGDGISGRVNQVWDFANQRVVPGRFGWKANRADIRITTAAAFNGDVGITTPLFPDQPCTPRQTRCLRTPTGNDAGGVELPDYMLQLVVDFTRNLGVPERRGSVAETAVGREMFYRTGCQSCHQPSYTTASRAGQWQHLGGQKIWPYSDLLLHDMGEELADNRPDYEATGREWRTAPLWGVGISEQVNGSHFLLHDGRARTVEEAILWHGGEAESVRRRFIELPAKDREALLKFVESL